MKRSKLLSVNGEKYWRRTVCSPMWLRIRLNRGQRTNYIQNGSLYTVRGRKKKAACMLTCLRHVSEYTMYYRLILAPKAEILHLTLGPIIIASGTVWRQLSSAPIYAHCFFGIAASKLAFFPIIFFLTVLGSTLWVKRGATLTVAVTLPTLDRSAKLFHCCEEH